MLHPDALIEVRTALDNEAVARRLAQELVAARLAACVHVRAVDSVYRWEGAVQQAHEWQLVCTTTAARYDALEAAIRVVHSYDLPAIDAVPVVRAHAPYAAWVLASTSPDGTATPSSLS